MPTPFELAQLAAQINPPDPQGMPGRNFENAAWVALELWEASTAVIQTKQDSEVQIKELIDRLPEMSDEEWIERWRDFKGMSLRLFQRLNKHRVSTRKLRAALFRDKSDSIATKDRMFLALVDFGKRNNVRFPIPSGQKFPTTPASYQMKTVKETLEKTLKNDGFIGGGTARWIVSCRQCQIAKNKKRP